MNVCKVLLGSALAAASWPALACYTVYDANSRVMYQGQEPPVDMSRPLHETVPQKFPGGQLVFDETSCALAPMTALSAHSSDRAPLFTDRKTARKIGVPYSLVSPDVAMVAPRDAAVAEAALPSRINVLASGQGSVMGGPPRAPSGAVDQRTKKVRPAPAPR